MLETVRQRVEEISEVKSFLVAVQVLSILTGATDARWINCAIRREVPVTRHDIGSVHCRVAGVHEQEVSDRN